VIVDCAVYEDGRRRAETLSLAGLGAACRLPNTFAWLGLHEPNADEFDAVAREFGLHELAVEDAVRAHQRPKLEAYDDTLFIVLKPASMVGQDLEFGEVLIFIGVDFLITVRHGDAPLHDARLWTEQRPDLLRCGPGAALYAIVDRIVDDYQPVIDDLDRCIEDIERQVFSTDDPEDNAAERIYDLKRQVLELHAAVAPLVDPLERLARGRHELVHDNVRPYFRDVHDHLLRMLQHIDTYRDILASALTANLTQVTVRQNEDMRKISAYAALFAAPSLVFGLYGMNFKDIPELHWTFGYPFALTLMVVIVLVLFRFFRRIGWL
jgi:magnesium transporter